MLCNHAAIMTIGDETSSLTLPPRTRRNTAEKVRSMDVVALTDQAMPSPSNGTSDRHKYVLWRFVCLNMFVCGIEICASAGFTYLPPMMLKAGFGEQSMTFVMGIGPFLALIAVPFLGRWSDRCRRRKPFLIGIALLMITSLILIAQGRRIGRFFDAGDAHLQAVLLVLGIVLLDFGCHAGFNPCEALVADLTTNSNDNETGFTVYSTMISLGGCIGYIITAVDWWSVVTTTSQSSSGGQGDQIAFSVILVLFIAAVLTTITVAKELDATWTHRADDFATKTHALFYIENEHKSDTTTVKLCSDDVGYETDSNNESLEESSASTLLPSPAPPPSIKRIKSDASCRESTTDCHGYLKVLTKLAFISSFATFRFSVLTVQRCYRDWPAFVFVRLPRALLAHVSTFRLYLRDIPLALRRLFVADFCSWTALMCHNMFYTDYMGQAVYGGNPNAGMNDDIGGRLYDDGVRMGSWGLLLHSITSILYVNTLQNSLIRVYGLRTTYFIGLVIFTLSITLTLMTNNLTIINLLAAMSGTGFAAITTIPNMLVTAYHSDKQAKYNLRESEEDDLPQSGLASDFSILDSAYFLSQIVLSLSVGTIVDLTRSVSSYLVISAAFGFLACFFSTRVIFPHEYIPL